MGSNPKTVVQLKGGNLEQRQAEKEDMSQDREKMANHKSKGEVQNRFYHKRN